MKKPEETWLMPVVTEASEKRAAEDKSSDSVLINRFKMGDEKAFSSIVEKYQDRLLNAARSILGDNDEAMDISQETFVKAYFNLGKFRGDSGLYTWLYRILYNLCISSIRRKKIISFLSFDDPDETREFVSKFPDPEEEFKRKEFRKDLKYALLKLPIRQRTVFIMKQMDNMKHEEIAQAMGITEGAVKASYFHAVKKLKSLLSRYGDAYEM